MMGLEEHLIHMFREDFEFGDGNAPSHLHNHAPKSVMAPAPTTVDDTAVAVGPTVDIVPPPEYRTATPTGSHEIVVPEAASAVGLTEEEGEGTPAAAVAAVVTSARWLPPAEAELKKIPFFVRGKARRNTERYAIEHGIAEITVDTLYDAKAFYGR